MKELSKPTTETTAPEDLDGSWEKLHPPLPPLGILAGLNEQSLANLAAYGQYQQYSTGETLIQEGDPQNRFYVVVSGKLAISTVAGGREVPLSMAEPGECLGEGSLLEPGPASASVRVVKPALLWSMDLDDLRHYLAKHAGGGGALLMGMAQCLSQRLRQSNLLISRHHSVPLEIPLEMRERVITAENTPVQLGFFDRLRKSFQAEKKVRISTEIKL